MQISPPEAQEPTDPPPIGDAHIIASYVFISFFLNHRIPPSPAVMSALSVLQQEEKLKKLDSNSDAVYVLVSPEVPYIVLWASTKFPQVC